MKLFKQKTKDEAPKLTSVPRHIAIIMDGNGRWAQRRGLPRTAGHAAGAETFRTIATYCKDIGVDYLTVYAFSTENWKRSQEEVEAIMSLLEKYLIEAMEIMQRDHIRMKIFGDTSRLSPKLQKLIEKTDEISSHQQGVQVNICLNYGGRDEIIRAARAFIESGRPAGELTEETLPSYMYSAGVPDPELIIRPGGEYRLSNFLMWESAYSELYFTDKYWPDFTPQDIDQAIFWFNNRSRRYGGV